MICFLNLANRIGPELIGTTDLSRQVASIVVNLPLAAPPTPTEKAIVSAIAVGIAVLFVVGLLAWLAFTQKKEKPSDPFERGRFLIDAQEARKIADDLRPKDDPGLPWGGLQLSSTARTTHFFLVGRTGSGKTILLRCLMQAALPDIGLIPDQRALVYDPKLDFIPVLYGMGLRCPVKILCPFDLRSVAWDIAGDCTEPATAIEVAVIIVPDEEGQNRYFPDAVRDFIQGNADFFPDRHTGRVDPTGRHSCNDPAALSASGRGPLCRHSPPLGLL